MKKKIKAVNLAVGIEISREREMIRFEGHFWKGIRIRRALPLTLIKILLKLKKFVAHFRKHIITKGEIPVEMLRKMLAEEQDEIRYVEDDITLDGMLISFFEEKKEKWAYIGFAPPVEDYNKIVVPKKEFLEAIEELIQ